MRKHAASTTQAAILMALLALSPAHPATSSSTRPETDSRISGTINAREADMSINAPPRARQLRERAWPRLS